MKKVLRVGEKGKPKLEAYERPLTGDLETRVNLIQAVIPLGLEAVGEVLAREVEELAGARYSRNGGKPGLHRWGGQGGSIYLGEQKLPIKRPRVRNQKNKQEMVLKTYSQLQRPQKAEELVFKKILAGLSCRHFCQSLPERCKSRGCRRSAAARVKSRCKRDTANPGQSRHRRDGIRRLSRRVKNWAVFVKPGLHFR